MVALQHLTDLEPAPLDLAATRAEVERLQHGLPATLLATRPEEIRRLARTALDAEKAALRRRSKVGDEPEIDHAAADEAVAAFYDVRAAREGLTEAAGDAMRWLAIGNAWGIAGLAVAGGLIVKGHLEPMATPVYSAVVGAASGPITTALLGLSRRSFATMRVSQAVGAWGKALAAAGHATMGDLHARRIAHAAYRRRAEEARVANAVARDARAAWHRVAGPKRHPREAPALVAQLTALRAAQLDLLRALIEQRMRPHEIHVAIAPSQRDTGPVAITIDDPIVPFDVVWAVPQPVAGGDDREDDETANIWSRLRGRLRLSG